MFLLDYADVILRIPANTESAGLTLGSNAKIKSGYRQDSNSTGVGGPPNRHEAIQVENKEDCF